MWVSFLLTLLVFGFSSGAAADSVRVGGLYLNVDQVVEVDAETTRVSLFGATSIVPRAQVAEFVLDRYRQNPAELSRIDPRGLLDATREALATPSLPHAAVLLATVIVHPQISVDEQRTLFLQVPEAQRIELFQNMLLRSDVRDSATPEALLEIVYQVGVSNADWLRRESPGIVVRVEARIRDRAIEDLFSLPSHKRTERLARILAMIRGLYGYNSVFARELAGVEEALREAIEAVDGAGGDDVSALLERYAESELALRLLRPMFLEALHRRVEEHLASSDVTRAFETIAKVPLTERTERTHNLLLQLLQRLPPGGHQLLFDPRFELLVRTVSRNDPKVRNLVIETMTVECLRLIESAAFPQAQRCSAALIKIRSDPDRDNDRLRLAHLIALTRAGKGEEASDKLKEIQTSIGISGHLRLLFSGVYPLGLIITIIVCCGSVAAALMYLGRGDSTIAGEGELPRDRPMRSGPQISSDNIEMVRSLMARPRDPLYDEYCECLKLLGCEDAHDDLQKIKSRYRSLVKKLHPDSRPGDTTAPEFITITKAYERVVELHRKIDFSKIAGR